MRILARHPGAPHGELGEYYSSYGVDVEEESPHQRREQDRPGPSDDRGLGEAWADASDDYDPDDDADYELPVLTYSVEYGDDWDEEYDWEDDDQENGSYPAEAILTRLITSCVEMFSLVVEDVEKSAVRWMARWSTRLAEISLGVIYIWFGALKLYPALSPAEGLVLATVAEISDKVGIPLPATPAFILLASWEVVIGLGFIFRYYRRIAVWMLIAHLPATTLPFLLLPDLVWTRAPLGLTLEGQYIVKNLALLSAALAVGATTTRPRRHDER